MENMVVQNIRPQLEELAERKRQTEQALIRQREVAQTAAEQ